MSVESPCGEPESNVWRYCAFVDSRRAVPLCRLRDLRGLPAPGIGAPRCRRTCEPRRGSLPDLGGRLRAPQWASAQYPQLILARVRPCVREASWYRSTEVPPTQAAVLDGNLPRLLGRAPTIRSCRNRHPPSTRGVGVVSPPSAGADLSADATRARVSRRVKPCDCQSAGTPRLAGEGPNDPRPAPGLRSQGRV